MLAFFAILFFMLILETVVGFGSTSIGIPILSLVLGTESSVNLMATTGLVLCFVLFLTQFKKLDRREFLIIAASILPFLPAGYLLYAQIRSIEWLLRLMTGTVVTSMAAYELWRRLIKKDDTDLPRWAVYSSLILGAIMEAMFSMGGPLINVYALTRVKDKSIFRATMAAIWVLTLSLSIGYRVFFLKAYSASTWSWILCALPLVFVAFLLGNKLHHQLPDEKFIPIVYGIQLASGLFSVAGGITLLVSVPRG